MKAPEIVYVVVTSHQGRELTRMKTRARDKFTCQDCGEVLTPAMAKEKKRRLFDIHHLGGLCGVKSRAYDKESEMANLITLCHRCHFNRPEHASKSLGVNSDLIARNKRIYEQRMAGATMKQLAKRYKVSRQRIDQIIQKVRVLH